MTIQSLLTAIGAALLGGSSLIALLAIARQKAPHLFSQEAKGLRRVLKTQGTHRLDPEGAQEGEISSHLLTTLNTTPRTRATRGTLTLTKRLRYAQWRISPSLFHLFSALISSVILVALVPYTNTFTHALTIVSGPLIMNGLLTRAIEKRCNAFDADYPQFLLSMVGLLKTGLAPITALETSAKALRPHSLV